MQVNVTYFFPVFGRLAVLGLDVLGRLVFGLEVSPVAGYPAIAL